MSHYDADDYAGLQARPREYIVVGGGDGYDLLVEEGVGLAIRCRLCTRVSHHPQDVHNRYCGNCHIWHNPAVSDTAPPQYWMDEVGQELKPAVRDYLHHQHMTEAQVGVMRAYLRQWIDSRKWDPDDIPRSEEYQQRLERLRAAAKEIRTQDDIRDWLRDAGKLDIDPL